MAKFGGMGGITGGRQLNQEDDFEMTIYRLFGEEMKENENLCHDIWSSLANVDWFHKKGDTATYSFRAAGDMIAAIRGHGDYMDWYCRSPYSSVSDYISELMEKEGWTHEDMSTDE